MSVTSPLLSPEDSAKLARPLRTWTTVDREQLAQMVQDALGCWQEAFGLESSVETVRCEPAWEALEGTRLYWTALDEGVLWALGGSVDPHAVLLEALFGEDEGVHSGRVADDMASAAWKAWGDQLRALAGKTAPTTPPADGLPHDARNPWSGSLWLCVPWCGLRLEVVLGDREVSACLKRKLSNSVPAPSSAPLVPVLQAVAGQTIPVTADLVPLHVDLGTLMGLSIGDVLCTDHALERPLDLSTPGVEGPFLLCQGFLGQSGNQRAVELLRPPSRTIRVS